MGYDHYPFNSDTDIYHMNAVQWLKEYGTVKGLANLNNRFGFNSTWHMLAAFIDQGLFKARSPWILPCISYICSFSYFLYETLNEEKLWRILYSISILFWTIINISTWGFPSLHYDFVPLLINSIVFYEVLKHVDEETSPSLAEHFIWMILLSFSFTLKQIGALSIIFLYAFSLYSLRKSKNLTIQNLFKISVLPLFILSLWITRNLLLSGYPFYPSVLGRVQFDWTYPQDQLTYLFQEVLGWARGPGKDYMIHGEDKGFSWVPTWLTMQKSSVRFSLVATIPALIAIALWSVNLFRNKNPLRFFFLFWPLACLSFWFLTAPDIRFGDGLFFCLLGAGFCFNPFIRKINISSRFLKKAFAASLLLMTLGASVILIFQGKRGPINFLAYGKHGPAPMRLTTTPGGIKLWEGIVPRICDKESQTHICPSNMDIYKDAPACGYSKLPCTPWVGKVINNKVELRGKTLANGFKTRLDAK
jgi:hypothetical protein